LEIAAKYYAVWAKGPTKSTEQEIKIKISLPTAVAEHGHAKLREDPELRNGIKNTKELRNPRFNLAKPSNTRHRFPESGTK
jgi:hypothetical protein